MRQSLRRRHQKRGLIPIPHSKRKQRSVKTRVTVRHFSLPSEHRLRLGFAGQERWSDIFSTLVYVFLDFLWRSQLKSAPRRCGFG
ncbi:hypothetical protein BHE74_00053276 [Ensete ventricosum]|nr:hypothetical protein BHE74_00053276 [Ensete ventricosum]